MYRGNYPRKNIVSSFIVVLHLVNFIAGILISNLWLYSRLSFNFYLVEHFRMCEIEGRFINVLTLNEGLKILIGSFIVVLHSTLILLTVLMLVCVH